MSPGISHFSFFCKNKDSSTFITPFALNQNESAYDMHKLAWYSSPKGTIQSNATNCYEEVQKYIMTSMQTSVHLERKHNINMKPYPTMWGRQ